MSSRKDVASSPHTDLSACETVSSATELVPLPGIESAGLPAHLIDDAREYVRAARAPSTLAAYARQFRVFASWCDQHGLLSVPASPDTVGAFLAEMAKRHRPSSLTAYIAAITFAHRDAGHAFDRAPLGNLMAGIRRTHGTAERRSSAITTAELRGIMAALPDSPQGVRDRALLLLGFAAALRRSELVGLDVSAPAADGTGIVAITEEGIRVTVRRSKVDQEGRGIEKGIPRGTVPCPVVALETWLALSGIKDGPVFRPIDKAGRIGAQRLTDRSVADIVKRSVTRAVRAAGGTTGPPRL